MKTFIDIPPEKITRGVIMSMMDTEFPVVECFVEGDHNIIPVACLNGLPIPWNVFVILFCTRFSKDRVKGSAPWVLEKKKARKDDDPPEPDPIMDCWDKIDIPANMRKFIEENRAGGSDDIMKAQIDLLFERHIMKEVPQDSFQRLVTEIDRIYSHSFANPVTI